MKLLLIFLLACSFSAFGDVTMPSCDERVTFERSGKSIVLSQEDILNNPEWHLGDGEPPITINDATEIVTSYIKSEFRATNIDFLFAHLKSESCIINGKMNTVWFYVFSLHDPEVLVGVSMAGRLIEAKIKE